jgi:hypothetical protein
MVFLFFRKQKDKELNRESQEDLLITANYFSLIDVDLRSFGIAMIIRIQTD